LRNTVAAIVVWPMWLKAPFSRSIWTIPASPPVATTWWWTTNEWVRCDGTILSRCNGDSRLQALAGVLFIGSVRQSLVPVGVGLWAGLAGAAAVSVWRNRASRPLTLRLSKAGPKANALTARPPVATANPLVDPIDGV